VSNPSGNAVPERFRMTWREGDEKPVVQRLASSSLVMPGMQVWNDAIAQQVFGQLRRVATAWIEARNISFKPEHAVNSVALDFDCAKWTVRGR
jgi:hypothetical protein